ncbi:MAG: dienelactone hydrolase family protein [Deltaproteobacteria bacterium]|nr:dienelactone hydrolase family protein [Deltaproteobacteria bacterium]
MRNNVVYAIEQGFTSLDFTTLKFNFRGVGESGGCYSEGEGETKDLIAAVKFLESNLEIGSNVVLSGYSFGAWICAKVSRLKENISGLLLVSYPFSVYDSEDIKNFRKPIYFICGTEDEISPLSENLKIYQGLPQIEKSILAIETDHFYYGKEKEITEFIKKHFLSF